MNKKLILVLGLLVALLSLKATAQTQTVKGQILDAQAQYPLFGATVGLIGSDPYLGTVADMDGYFKLENVPIGRQTLMVQYLGYKNQTIPNVLVTAGKEVVLQVKLEESVGSLEEVVVTADANKDLPINELAKVSARTFSLEEVTRYSGGRNDVARMAASFAGVSAPDDSRNDIVVRGNSPSGLLWRIEGLPVATVNHYNTLGSTGGPVSALNTNLLRNSDFMTGAFPAEYGNANAAVFDVNFRNGNTDKYEFTGQLAAFSGLEFMAEGPISREKNSSFVASYRYGIARFAATGTSAVPIYHDFSFKANLGQTKIGRFELFGLGGFSGIDFLGDEIDDSDLFANPNQDAYIDNALGLIGLSHLIRLNKTTYIKTILGVSSTYGNYKQDNLIRDTNGDVQQSYRATNVQNTENRYTFSSTLNKKFDARWSLRAGVVAELYDANFFAEDRDNQASIPDSNGDGVPDDFHLVRNFNDQYILSQGFAQAEYNITDDLSVTGGLHSQYHSYTGARSLEPRAAISWQFDPRQRLSLAYGLHAQAVPSPILFVEEEVSPGMYEMTNDNLGFTRSHHVVLGYDRNLSPSWRLKVETYIQYLFDVPVEQVSSSYSILNEGADFEFEERGSLVNEGTGRNYGAEVTLEKFFSNSYYLLMTASLFDSKYEGSDGVQRNTAFNNHFVYNVLFGKEWKFGRGQKNAWTFDTKLTTSGGKPYTPIDLDGTRNNGGEEVLFENQAYALRYDDYFRWDVKLGVRINSAKKNVSHQFFIDLQNVTNRKNVYERRYNEVTDEINEVEQIGFFPDLMYRIQF
ncbi:TonB-dependent receptor [Reichenbachiella carrageenanivorans]|uniref:TonB-dependent receptor n=1 Tax=Reichenbachiella carrageenanivorans TaxID=2979869 RepID=A0ABY6D2H2_9BACT|nr:TonB-dependent receptor [Reichenbachiella carrageenanivorans]UXX80357.1 TonB-dependent receptor [Reichenbachiella carrageenanivorans]